MNILHISDIGIDSQKDFRSPIIDSSEWANVTCIVSGNVGNLFCDATRRCISFLADSFQRVIYVPGKMEFYGRDISQEEEIIEIYESLGLIYLNQLYQSIEGVDFIGATLWHYPTISDFQSLLPEYSRVKESNDRLISISTMQLINRVHASFLQHATMKAKCNTTVVISSTAPHLDAIRKLGVYNLNSELMTGSVILGFWEKLPTYWLHGNSFQKSAWYTLKGIRCHTECTARKTHTPNDVFELNP